MPGLSEPTMTTPSQSLYRKWRSRTFDEMVGQQPIIDTLKNALKSGAFCHAYLFTGPRGTGKTSVARLLAKAVNCADLHDGEPCNECHQCQEITAGNSFNVIEIDAASNRGIDNIRDLREQITIPPATGNYKVYILDEAHMLTPEAFNALLKILEEPPSFVIFVMATTDVQKMLPTVVSRCQRFDFKRIAARQIVEHLLFVASEEQIEIEKSATELIARAASGSMRDALSLLDQVIAYAGSAVALTDIQSMLGVADPHTISTLITHIADLDSCGLLHLIHDLSEAGADLRQVDIQIGEYWRALLLVKAGSDVAVILNLTEDEVEEVRQLAPAFTLEELAEYTRVFAQNDLMQKSHGTPQFALELTALECVESHRQARLSAPPPRPYLLPPDLPSPPPIPASIPARPDGVIANHSQPEQCGFSTQEALAPHQAQASLKLERVVSAWRTIVKRTKQRSGLLAAYLPHCQVIGIEGASGETVVLIQTASPRHFAMVKSGDNVKHIEWAISAEFNQPCKVQFVPPDQKGKEVQAT